MRAACAALLLIDGRVRQEGLDLLTQLEQLPLRRKPRAPLSAALGAALVLLVPALATAASNDWSGSYVPGQREVGSLDRDGRPALAGRQRLRAVG